MNVRALGGISSTGGGYGFGHLHLELHGKILRRIAGGLVAGLIAQVSADHVFDGNDVMEWTHQDADRKCATVYAQLLIRRERKAEFFALGISNLADHDVSRRIQFQDSRDQELGFWSVGIDVESGHNTKSQFHLAGLTSVNAGERGGGHGHGRSFRPGEILGGNESWAQKEKQAEFGDGAHFVDSGWWVAASGVLLTNIRYPLYSCKSTLYSYEGLCYGRAAVVLS